MVAGSTPAAAGTGIHCQKSSPMLKLTFDKKVKNWAQFLAKVLAKIV
jgi:hypothetical protein